MNCMCCLASSRAEFSAFIKLVCSTIVYVTLGILATVLCCFVAKCIDVKMYDMIVLTNYRHFVHLGQLPFIVVICF